MEEFNIKGSTLKFLFNKKKEEITINVSHPKSIVSYETSIDLNNFNNSNDIEKNYELINSYFKKYSNTEINSVEDKNVSVETTHVNSPDNISLPAKSMFSTPVNNNNTISPFGAVLQTNNGSINAFGFSTHPSNKNESVFAFEESSNKCGFGASSSNNSCFGGAQFSAPSSNNSCFGVINNQKQRDIIFHLDFGVLKITFVQHSISIFLKEIK